MLMYLTQLCLHPPVLDGVSSLTVRVEGSDKQEVEPWAFACWTELMGLNLIVALLLSVCAKK